MKSIVKKIRECDPGIFNWLDKSFVRKSASSDPAGCIYIVAAPRSGSTLLFQLLVESLSVNYHTNLAYLLCRYPYIGDYVSRKLLKPYVSNFKSDYGFVSGLSGPSEANDFWKYWFGLKLNEAAPMPDPVRMSYAINYFQTLRKFTQKPFVVGWIGHAFYAKWMADLMPDSFFVVLKREDTDIALSLLNGRRSQLKDEMSWFSMKPSECDEQFLDPHKSVARQAYYINRKIDAIEQRVTKNGNGISITYNEMCANPSAVINRLEQAYPNCKLIKRDRFRELPKSFKKSDSKKRFRDDVNKIEIELRRIREGE